MDAVTLTTSIAVPKKTLFNYLTDINNLPEWAIEFCQQLRSSNGKYIVTTPAGECFFTVESQWETGVIDFISSPDGVRQTSLPSRVLGAPEKGAIYVVTCVKAHAMSQEQFRQQTKSLEREMEHLKRLFS